MSQPIDVLVEFLRSDGWKFHRTETDEVGIFVSGKAGRWLISSRYSERSGVLVVNSYCPVVVPAEARQAVADFITRANWGMSLGGFEMDMEDGDLRFKASVPVRNDPMTPATARHVIYVGMAMMERYLPGLLTVIYSGTLPARAIGQCENRRVTRPRTRRTPARDNIDISDAKMREIFEKITGTRHTPPPNPD